LVGMFFFWGFLYCKVCFFFGGKGILGGGGVPLSLVQYVLAYDLKL